MKRTSQKRSPKRSPKRSTNPTYRIKKRSPSQQSQEDEQQLDHRSMLIILNQHVYHNKSCEQMYLDPQQLTQEPFFKYMMKNPSELQIQDLVEHFPWGNCIIQAKASGFRCLLTIYKGNVYLVFESKIDYIGSSPLQRLSVFECELMEEGSQKHVILCYDQHMFEDKPIHQSIYFYRIWKLQSILDQVASVSDIDHKYILKAKQFEQIKPYLPYKEIKKILKRIYDTPFENDGLIINTNDPLQYQRMYKWKPVEKLTIDFQCTQKDQNTRVYNLNVYDSFQNKSVPFTSPIIECSNIYEADVDMPSLDQKVVEFNYDVQHNKWVFLRIRDDKGLIGRGNSLKVARIVLSSILYYISFEMLCTGTGEVYFEYKRLKPYKAMTRFVNEVKQMQIHGIYEMLLKLKEGIQQDPKPPITTVLDLGSGKGQDILKFQDFSNVICIDNDKYALWELNQRTSALRTTTKVRTIQANLAQWESFNLLPTNVDFLNCNLALHYFIDSFTYIVKSTNPIFINLVILDGSKLTQEQTILENNQVKYHYHVIKNDPTRIKIKLPFRDKLSDEVIIDPQNIIEQLKYINYKLDKYQSLSEFNIEVPDLTNADRQHIANYAVLQFSRQQ